MKTLLGTTQERIVGYYLTSKTLELSELIAELQDELANPSLFSGTIGCPQYSYNAVVKIVYEQNALVLNEFSSLGGAPLDSLKDGDLVRLHAKDQPANTAFIMRVTRFEEFLLILAPLFEVGLNADNA
jgi:hypothetical protein